MPMHPPHRSDCVYIHMSCNDNYVPELPAKTSHTTPGLPTPEATAALQSSPWGWIGFHALARTDLG